MFKEANRFFGIMPPNIIRRTAIGVTAMLIVFLSNYIVLLNYFQNIKLAQTIAILSIFAIISIAYYILLPYRTKIRKP